ncbi:carbohydrate binding domain-containing protein [Polaribacter undariae]|uniref:Carbohydrate binding domain-containing protein n=1 Tax=Polaribacter sejongensis TaxID=985043 RepID=A0AAJ1QYM8_9FLAO|nr:MULTISPECIES: carbohydrate binding domain-containing protein [Polaribacter]MDN3620535.1 carbohydrate binding domain-containing protein [Polaribacter undariae]QVY64083.1 carbohydrate binding domain-containing protein [Polaribacter sp. Q13]UWD31261.1 carbohydrate binding domain-containing protein [Polaribacter undariae]
MKKYKILGLLCLFMAFCSCTNNDDDVAALTQPTFTVTESAENPGVYSFENTTPNKGEFYSYWEFEVAGNKVADKAGAVEYKYKESGSKFVTLTMVSVGDALQTSQTIDVIVPVAEVIVTNPENLLLNGYLVEGDGDDFTNWSAYNGGDNIFATTDALIGGRAATISNSADADPWSVQFVSDAIETVVGDQYTVSFWGKGNGEVVRFSTKPDASAQYGPDYTLTSEWQQYTWTITANEAATNISLDMGKSAGTFVIDVIEVVKGDTAPALPSDTSLILNGGFEDGSGNDFTNWGKYNGGDFIVEETSDVLSGARAVKVSNSAAGDPWSVQFVSDAIETEIDAEYEVTLWAKGDPAVIRYSTKPDATAKYGPDYTITADWAKYTWTFVANEANTNISLDMGASAGTFIIDDLKVEKK